MVFWVMDITEYLVALNRIKKLSNVKVLIVKKLWGSDTRAPVSLWIRSSELLELTKQKYFDRRMRELRDQYGCDIETEYISTFNEHCWRLKTSKLATVINREYLTEPQKKALFENYHYSCAICGRHQEPGVRGLQADHKVPLSRQGSNDLSNWQAICNNCNVGKRRACEGCILDCATCSWAFPEKFGIPLIVNLNHNLLKALKEYVKKHMKSEAEIVAAAIDEYLKENS